MTWLANISDINQMKKNKRIDPWQGGMVVQRLALLPHSGFEVNQALAL